MGGNLFKFARVDKARYDEIVSSLIPVLNKHFAGYYKIPVAYRSKKDYGDVDILLDAACIQNKRDWAEKLMADLGVTNTQSVRNVFSMSYMNFQVDIFLVGTRRLESTYNFMSYNILGNLIGRIYHKFNLKYGEDGLFYVMRGYNDHSSKEISITRDMNKMLTFVGLSYERWLQGFSTLEEIFEYMISSPYFCSNSYDPQYFNVRKRAAERPDFLAFLTYLEENKIDKNYPFDKKKEVYLELIDGFFVSNLKEEYQKHLERQEVLQKIANKFNGRIVMELLGIQGEELGNFIYAYKKVKGEGFEEFILTSDLESIKNDIKFNHSELY
jgi:hypothetical protein